MCAIDSFLRVWNGNAQNADEVFPCNSSKLDGSQKNGSLLSFLETCNTLLSSNFEATKKCHIEIKSITATLASTPHHHSHGRREFARLSRYVVSLLVVHLQDG